MNKTALAVQEKLKQQGICPTVVDPVFVKPLDYDLFMHLISSHKFVVTLEEHSLKGGLGTAVQTFITENKLTPEGVLNLGIEDEFLEHGSYKEVLFDAGLSKEQVYKSIVEAFHLTPSLAGIV